MDRIIRTFQRKTRLDGSWKGWIVSGFNQKEGRIREIELEVVRPPSIDAGPPAVIEERSVFSGSFECNGVYHESLSDHDRLA
jgi:hypothetical protein